MNTREMRKYPQFGINGNQLNSDTYLRSTAPYYYISRIGFCKRFQDQMLVYSSLALCYECSPIIRISVFMPAPLEPCSHPGKHPFVCSAVGKLQFLYIVHIINCSIVRPFKTASTSVIAGSMQRQSLMSSHWS